MHDRRVCLQMMGLSALGAALPLYGGNSVAAAESKSVRIMLDWVVQSTHAPFFVAKELGYFQDAGIDVAIDGGKGATNTAVNIASGVYQFGYLDMPSLIRFNAQNPQTPLQMVYVSFDDTPSCIVTLKSKGIRTPKDLDGKKIAGQPGTAIHDTISILLHAAKADDVHINWIAITPQLFPTMLKRGVIDGIGAFTNSQIPGLLEVGYRLDELEVIRYSDFGANLYGLGLATTQKFATENPNTVKKVVAAFNRATRDVVKSPDQALELMRKRDPGMNPESEKVRLEIVIGLTATKHVVANGLSSVTPERLMQTIGTTVEAYKLSSSPAPETIYSEAFLPPKPDRMLLA
jgi:NitT/TauT family transport system substrate-binding protein